MDLTVVPGECARLLNQLVQLWQRNASSRGAADVPAVLDREMTRILREITDILALESRPDASVRQQAVDLHKLTRRERDVIAWLARGKTVSDIGILMQISQCTVRTYIQRSLKKLDASNRTHAVSRALSCGLIDP